MPIKEENRNRYPDNWEEIRKEILKRAENKCEFCGVENYAIGYRDDSGEFCKVEGMEGEVAGLEERKIIKIILTIAHLNHKPEDNRPENLKALCQKCHNNYDSEHRKKTRVQTRMKKEMKAGQRFFFYDNKS